MWFVARILIVIVALGAPIVAISSQLVSVVNADIVTANHEVEDLNHFRAVIALMSGLVTLQADDIEDRTAAVTADRRAVDALYAGLVHAYHSAPANSATRAGIRTAVDAWQRSRAAAGPTHLTPLIAALRTLLADIDEDSPLETDPSETLQYLASLSFNATPRLLFTDSKAADVADGSVQIRTSIAALEDLAAAKNELDVAAASFEQFLHVAITRDGSLAAEFSPRLAEVQAIDAQYARTIRTMLTGAAITSPSPRLAAHREALRSLRAQVAMWRAFRDRAEVVVHTRRERQIAHRRAVVGGSACAVLLGTLCIALIGRYMLRRDRIALASAQLEADKLRAEVRQMSAERALRLQEAQFQSVFENTDLGIVLYYFDDRPAHHNVALERMLGARTGDFIDKRAALVGQFQTSRSSIMLDERVERDREPPQWLSLRVSGVYDDGRCAMVVLLVRDITEERSLQDELVHAASHDGLTQLANRRAFDGALATLIADPREPFALIYIDLDDFKPINDTLGHAAGDIVLATMAERLRSSVSSIDTCARLGGDEFAVIVRVENDRARVASIAARLVRNLMAPIHLDGNTVSVSASVGVVERRPGMNDGEVLKAEADRALYTVKASGGNAFAFAEVPNPDAGLQLTG